MRFSIIIPLYNKAPYVEKALQSIFAQTFTDWELIVVDDGSTDNSLEVVERVNDSTNQRFSIVSQKNSGVSSARNNGVAASHGDYVCFLDADDWWTPTFLEEMDKLISDYQDAGIYGTSYYIVKNSNNRIAPIALDDGFERGYIDYIKVYSRFLCMPLWTGSVCIPRHIFDEMQGFKPQLKMGEDFDLWIRIALKYKVAFVNKQLAYYNQDVDPKFRGVGRLHKPEHHELFYYSEYEEEYPDCRDLKQLLDNKRVYNLFPYYLSKEYCSYAKVQLKKVEWKKQPIKWRLRYKMPLCIIKGEIKIERGLSVLKNKISINSKFVNSK